MGRTWRKEDREYNKKKFRKGEAQWNRKKRTLNNDEPIIKPKERDREREVDFPEESLN